MKSKKKNKKNIDIEAIKQLIIDIIQFIGSLASIISIILYFIDKMQK